MRLWIFITKEPQRPAKVLSEIEKGAQFAYLNFHAGFITSDMILNKVPKIRYINLFACSQADFNEKNSIGVKLLFDNPYTLNLTGCTASYGQFPAKTFVDEMGSTQIGNSVGLATKNFISKDLSDEINIRNMIKTRAVCTVLFGDPTLRYKSSRKNNTVPTFNSKSAFNDIKARPNQRVDLDLRAYDAEHDQVTTTLLQKPSGVTFNQARGVYEWTPTMEQIGDNTFEVELKDTAGNKYISEFKVVVLGGLDLKFEPVAQALEAPWFFDAHDGPMASPSEYYIDGAVKRSGQYAAKIVCRDPNDARFVVPMSVQPNSTYTIKGYIKTDTIIGQTDSGASLTVGLPNPVGANDFVSSVTLKGTNEWREVEVTFNTGNRTSVNVWCRVGNFGDLAKGTAWFDDLTLTKIN
jgi:hypothetical protein